MTAEQMQVALQALPPLQVACLVLSKRDHMNNEEIAQAIGITLDEVHQSLVAGLIYLARMDQMLKSAR